MALSRQETWQGKMQAAGLCIICGKNPVATRNHCAPCADRQKARNRERYHRLHPEARTYVTRSA